MVEDARARRKATEASLKLIPDMLKQVLKGVHWGGPCDAAAVITPGIHTHFPHLCGTDACGVYYQEFLCLPWLRLNQFELSLLLPQP